MPLYFRTVACLSSYILDNLIHSQGFSGIYVLIAQISLFWAQDLYNHLPIDYVSLNLLETLQTHCATKWIWHLFSSLNQIYSLPAILYLNKSSTWLSKPEMSVSSLIRISSLPYNQPVSAFRCFYLLFHLFISICFHCHCPYLGHHFSVELLSLSVSFFLP